MSGLVPFGTLQRCSLALLLLALSACSQLEAILGPDHEVVVAADFAALEAAPQSADETQALVRDSEALIRARLEAVGIAVQSLAFEGDARMRLVVSGARGQSRIERLVGSVGRVEVRYVDQAADAGDLESGIAPPGRDILRMGDGSRLLAVHRLGAMEGEGAVLASAGRDEETFIPVLTISLDPQGQFNATNLPELGADRQVAVILDGQVLTTANVTEPMTGRRVTMEGWSTLESAQDLAVVINHDPLPVPFGIATFEAVN